jgi:hypothetical protein
MPAPSARAATLPQALRYPSAVANFGKDEFRPLVRVARRPDSEPTGGDAQKLMGEYAQTLAAFSVSAVHFDALTYIGNAPN